MYKNIHDLMFPKRKIFGSLLWRRQHVRRGLKLAFVDKGRITGIVRDTLWHLLLERFKYRPAGQDDVVRRDIVLPELTHFTKLSGHICGKIDPLG